MNFDKILEEVQEKQPIVYYIGIVVIYLAYTFFFKAKKEAEPVKTKEE